MMQRTTDTQSLMDEFAVATGLADQSSEPRRYLWTDAFAVCNYLGLYRQTEKPQYLNLALQLVDQVHQTLGKHHRDSSHSGWLCGLDDEQARSHPTQGGLRIGKKLNERQAHEPFDEQLEWDRDGQYFHYLTKWMHALNRVSQVTGDGIYNTWALELAKAAHAGFTYISSSGEKRMVWKMSTDLSRPLVESMGHHDPLDGLITYLELQATAKLSPETPAELCLETEILDMETMCKGRNWATQDPLGLGGLLTDAYRLTQLIAKHNLDENVRLELLLNDIEISLEAFVQQNQLHQTAEYRLAFRELGLAIGLQGIDRMQELIKQNTERFTNASKLSEGLTGFIRYIPIVENIENFWREQEHRVVNTWLEHADINNVMLATSLAPEGYL